MNIYSAFLYIPVNDRRSLSTNDRLRNPVSSLHIITSCKDLTTNEGELRGKDHMYAIITERGFVFKLNSRTTPAMKSIERFGSHFWRSIASTRMKTEKNNNKQRITIERLRKILFESDQQQKALDYRMIFALPSISDAVTMWKKLAKLRFVEGTTRKSFISALLLWFIVNSSLLWFTM